MLNIEQYLYKHTSAHILMQTLKSANENIVSFFYWQRSEIKASRTHGISQKHIHALFLLFGFIYLLHVVRHKYVTLLTVTLLYSHFTHSTLNDHVLPCTYLVVLLLLACLLFLT